MRRLRSLAYASVVVATLVLPTASPAALRGIDRDTGDAVVTRTGDGPISFSNFLSVLRFVVSMTFGETGQIPPRP
ncbi:MAG: hypothetical protein U0X73_00800 [Thermoanaerobaculia bacterium]